MKIRHLALPSLALAIAVLGFGAVAAQEKEHPIIAQVKPALKDATQPFTLLVMIRVKAGEEEKFEAAFAKASRASRQEKGNAAYDLARDAKSPSQYVVYERWKSLPALEQHLNAPHFNELVSQIGPLLEGAPDVRVLLPAKE